MPLFSTPDAGFVKSSITQVAEGIAAKVEEALTDG